MPRTSALALVTVLAACGRLEFDHQATAVPDSGAAEDSLDALTGFPPCNPTAPFGAPVLVPELSDTATADGTLRLLPDELSGYLWRGNPGAQDIFYVSRPRWDAPFTVMPITGGVNTGANELDPTLTADGAMLVFRRSGPGDELYSAPLVTPTMFGTATAITSLNTASTEAQGFFPIGSDILYFQSTRTTVGDIYISTRTGTTFSAPTEIAELSTGSAEGDPVLTPDQLTIFFRSNRVAAMAGFNIFTATRATSTGTFGIATIVDNINTDLNDGASWISPDGCRLYLSSDVAGTNDIYVSTRGS